jgi:hypothetical protein
MLCIRYAIDCKINVKIKPRNTSCFLLYKTVVLFVGNTHTKNKIQPVLMFCIGYIQKRHRERSVAIPYKHIK